MTTKARQFSVMMLAAIAGCSSSHHEVPGTGQVDAAPPSSVDAPTQSHIDAPVPQRDASPYRYVCDQPPPPGATVPPVVAPRAGLTCPTLVPGTTNTITSSANARDFILVLPAGFTPDEKLPVLFMWHWIGGTAQAFLERGQVQAAADAQRFIAVLPVAKGANVIGTSFNTKWPFDISQSPARMTEEFDFFDDMLACVEAQYNVNTSCVSTIGVSAGALFTDQLAQARSDRLSSFVSLSGGTGATIIKPWAGAARKLPGIVLWGGDGPPAMDGNRDLLGCLGIGMDFSVASNDLETGLVAGGHFFIECKHNCGHVEPPLDGPDAMTKYAGIWEFTLNHPFWLAPGTSPYSAGLPMSLPTWCGIGDNSATPRSGGGCPMAENPCTQ